MALAEKKTIFTFHETSGTLTPARNSESREVNAPVEPLLNAKEQLRSSLKQVISLEHHVDFFPGLSFAQEIKDLLFAKYSSDDAMGFLLQLMFSFLEADTVEDYLENDDSSRKAMESAVFADYGETGKTVIENNKLRPNKLAETFEPMGMIVDIVSAYSPESASELKLAYSLLDPRATQWEDREYVSPQGEKVTRPFPIYKGLTRAEKQEVVDSYIFASFRMIEVLLSAKLTQEVSEQVTW